MEMLRYLSKRPSRPVGSWGEVKHEVKSMLNLVDGEFKGEYPEALALSHSQVSEMPYRVFVMSSKFQGIDVNQFPYRVIVNAEIVEAKEFFKWGEVHPEPQEKCEGKPDLPNTAMMSEACVSFPHRKARLVRRFNKIRVSFLTPAIVGLKKVEMELEGLASQVFQHNIDLANGINIYGLYLEDMPDAKRVLAMTDAGCKVVYSNK